MTEWQTTNKLQQKIHHLCTMNVTMTRPNMVLKTTAITELMMMISGLSALYCIASKTQSIYMSLYDGCTSINVIISVNSWISWNFVLNLQSAQQGYLTKYVKNIKIGILPENNDKHLQQMLYFLSNQEHY